MDRCFESEHLTVRKFKAEDARRLYEIHSEEGYKKWMPNESYADIEESLGAIEFYNTCVDAGHLPYVLAVELKETGELIGDAGINEVDGKPDEVEIGYGICEKYGGKGYATELVAATTKFVFSTFPVETLYGRVMKGNNASVRVLEKNGYRFVAEEHSAEDDPYGNGMLVYLRKRNSTF